MAEWIKVTDKLPPLTHQQVLVAHTYYQFGRAVDVAFYIDKSWRLKGYSFDATPYVTHWMPFPDCPED